MFDIGNMLRFPSELPPAFAEGFIAGYAGTGGHLPDNWRELSQAADLFALADFLTRPPAHLFFGKAVQLIRELLKNDRQGTLPQDDSKHSGEPHHGTSHEAFGEFQYPTVPLFQLKPVLRTDAESMNSIFGSSQSA
jgi:hypothetical protein